MRDLPHTKKLLEFAQQADLGRKGFQRPREYYRHVILSTMVIAELNELLTYRLKDITKSDDS